MASKKELGQEIAGLKREQRRINMIREHQGAELARYRAEEHRRREHNAREAQRKHEEQQLKDRREYLDHLGAGRLPLKQAESWAFVHEPGKSPAIEVTVPLDDEGLRILQEHLQPKPKPRNSFADLRDIVRAMPTPLAHRSPIGNWDDFLYGGRPSAFRI